MNLDIKERKLTAKDIAENLGSTGMETTPDGKGGFKVTPDSCMVGALYRISMSLDAISGRLCALEQIVSRFLGNIEEMYSKQGMENEHNEE